MELLFESRREIVGRRGRLIPFQATARVGAEPILRPGPDGSVVLYGTVLHDEGKYRMWHQVAPADHDWQQDISGVGILESEDGITWAKPSTGHLTNLGLHSPAISKKNDLYLATGCVKRSLGVNPAASEPGYYVATSRDGIDWKLVETARPIPGGDVITSIWDERDGTGRAAYKLLRYYGGIQRRSIFEATFSEEGWGPSRLALMPGEADDIAALGRGYRSADYYGMTLMPSGKTGMLGFVWMFYHQPPYFKSGSAMFGGGALVLAYKENAGDAWVFSPGRIPFLEHPSEMAQKPFFYAASSVLSVGDEQRLYCSAFHRGHGATLNEERKREPEAIQQLQNEGLASIHLAQWKRDRFFGFRAETVAELILNIGPVTQPAKLLLNYKTAASGWIRVGVTKGSRGPFITGFSALPATEEEGFSTEESISINGDECSGTVGWLAGNCLPITEADQPLLITIRMFMAECYAYEIVENPL